MKKLIVISITIFLVLYVFLGLEVINLSNDMRMNISLFITIILSAIYTCWKKIPPHYYLVIVTEK